MTLQEFKAWFEAFNEGLSYARTGDDALAVIAEKLATVEPPKASPEEADGDAAE